MATGLNAPQFQDADKAREYLEAQVWPNGPICPHCGVIGKHWLMKGKSTRPGLYKCTDCREPFTVTVGTVFERSKIPLNKWLLAVYLLCSSKKGMSSHQLHRTLGVTYKTAWFMTHRIRKAMETRGFAPMGGGGKIVEADETYWGQIKGQPKKAGGWTKHKIVSLVERGGEARSFHVPFVTAVDVRRILRNNVAKDANLMTDESHVYDKVGREFASHETVVHSRKEYVRGNVHTNTAESFFNILKRGLIGTYHHVGEQHLQKYVSEFDFRYNNRTALGVTDAERSDKALKGISGKRLTYRRTHAQ
jgi:transposase-like protein